MPGPVLRDPTPDWMRPENASVLDPWYVRAARLAGRLVGADDPASQVFALGAPMQVPAGTLGALAAPAEKAAMPAGKLGELQNFIKAYHGSPHDFEKFDMSKIGTGEGAQAYGHGLYFAEKEGTAKAYRQALSNAAVEVGGTTHQVPKWSANMSAQDRIIRRLADARSKLPDALDSEIISNVRDTLKGEIAHDAGRGVSLDDPWMKYGAQQLDHLAEMEKQGIKLHPGGKMYEVAIHADPEHFLDWDKPLSQQSPDVQRAVKKVAPNILEGSAEHRATGGETYRRLRDLIPADKVGELETTLRGAGIPGIKYLDQGSRAAGEGSRNYVVFDDKTIDILKKYGLAGAIGAGLMQPQRKADQ